MNIDELKYFVEAAREQNLSRAAKTLGITQSTLSHAVRRLETEFGCTLFEKKGKTVQLTGHGKSFEGSGGSSPHPIFEERNAWLGSPSFGTLPDRNARISEPPSD